MLTKKELQWLDNRGKFSCWYCPDIPQAMCTMGERPAHCAITDTDWKESAEFEGRVAAKLANIHFGTEDCPYCSNHINVNEYCGECKTASTDKRCLACRMKYARLKVEEEMDNEP